MNPEAQMQICLRCNYKLQGLPEEGMCPECGLEYGNDLILIGFKSASSSMTNALIGIIVLFILSFIFLLNTNFVCGVPMMFVALWYLFNYYKSGKSKDTIGGDLRWVVNSEGIRVIKDLNTDIPLLPWSQIQTVKTRGNLGINKRRWRTLIIKRRFGSLDWISIRGQQIWFEAMDPVSMREMRAQVLSHAPK